MLLPAKNRTKSKIGYLYGFVTNECFHFPEDVLSLPPPEKFSPRDRLFKEIDVYISGVIDGDDGLLQSMDTI